MALSFQNKIRQVGTPTVAPTTTPASGVSFASKIRPVAAPAPEQEKKGSMLGAMAKGLVSAPATLLARPFQAATAVAALPFGGVSNEQINEFTKNIPIVGDIVAPIGKTTGEELKKNVGRGLQTVALGVGSAPLAAGAAFGAGSSLEQGNDIFSTETLVSTLVGMGAGKALDLVGKPLLNASGKVIGKITPKILQDVASKGAGAVQNFMKQHELLGGIAKPISKKITKGAEVFDSTINKATKSLFTGAKEVAKTQYPTIKNDVAKYYEKTEMDKLMKPTKEAGATFTKATEVAKQAKARGIKLEKVAADNKIYIDDHISDGKYATAEAADALADDAISGGATVFRPALAEAETGVQRVPINEVRQRIASKISSIPDRVLSPEQKLAFARKVAKEYGDASVTSARYRDGYSLTNLYDSKLQTSSGLYKTPTSGGVQSISDTLTSQQKKIESDVFKELLIEKAPKGLGIDKYFKAQEEKFVLANYLRTLNGKNAVRSLFQKAVKRASQLSGATVGAQTAGPFGMFSGYQFGGMVADTFNNASNPVKISFLKSIGKTTPEIYGIMRQYVTEQEAARLLRPLLPAGSKVDAAMQGIKNEWGAIEMGYTPTPANTFGNDFLQNTKILNNTKQLPAPSPRTVVPNTQGTPNQLGAPYSPGGNKGDVGGMRQRGPRLFRG